VVEPDRAEARELLRLLGPDLLAPAPEGRDQMRRFELCQAAEKPDNT